MLDRRQWIQAAGGLAGALAASRLFGRRAWAEPATLPFANGERPLVAYPGKRPLLRLTERPPQLETPFSVPRTTRSTSSSARRCWSTRTTLRKPCASCTA